MLTGSRLQVSALDGGLQGEFILSHYVKRAVQVL